MAVLNKEKESVISISDDEKEKVILDSLKPKVKIISEVSSVVGQIIKWINDELKKLEHNNQHQGFLSLDFKYTDPARRTAIDTVLRLLGTRLLTEDERRDPQRPLSSGIQATTKPHIFISYEHLCPSDEEPIQEKYNLVISLKMQFPNQIIAQKIQQAEAPTQDVKPQPLIEEVPEEVLEEEVQKAKEMKRAPGIFEVINKVLLGDEEEE
ncbi:MAG: hypothetical protein COS97_02750 [Candidatus Nealsonbacteria bacterium CG07_land_8_20_14_0_80_40_10]|nr:MAG: hypothetical protein COS97_02750 [Candidatus Nealsonbacteria bacterium CG07_land_8_20_14_0_80_40_10]